MKLRLQLLIESDTGAVVKSEEIAQLEHHALRAEEIGLTLSDTKQILVHLQRAMVQEQVAAFLQEQSRCPECNRQLPRKGQHSLSCAHCSVSCDCSARGSIPALVSR